MKLNKLTIQGFRSFANPTIIDFNEIGNGFHFISGANGSGKSSLGESIAYCCWGKTSTNLKAGLISNWWSELQTSVTCEFEEGVITRTWNPNTLKLNGDTVTQEKIDSFLGLNFDSFLYSIFISQFVNKFFDLTAADKMEVFTSIMDDVLNMWETYSNKAATKQTELENNLTKLEKSKSKILGMLEGLDIKSIEENIANWEEIRQENIKDLKNTINSFIKEIEELQTKNKDAIIELEDCKDKEESYNNIEKITQDKLELVEEYLQESLKNINTFQAIHDTYSKQLTSILNIKDKCPVCGSIIDEEHLITEVDFINKELDIVSNSIKNNEKSYNTFKKEKSNLTTELKKTQEQLLKVSSNYTHIAYKIKAIKEDIPRIEKHIEELKKEIEEIENSVSPFQSLLNETQYKTKLLNKKLEVIEEELQEKRELKEVYKFWVKGFKDCRYLVVEDALKELEILVNNNLNKLGLSTWRVELGIEGNTKRKSFVVNVRSPFKPDDTPVPLEVWSGGEQQRIRLAGTLGLMDFISSRRGSSWNIEIFDEPTQWLEAEGIEALLDSLYYRAKDLNKQIWLIDQRRFNSFGGFSKIIQVEKNKEIGSTITIE
jgi:DNA repair exonuclease SbcCD ATPase subunit